LCRFMSLEWLKQSDIKRGPSTLGLTLDNQGRLMLSTAYRRQIAPTEAEKGIPFSIVMSYDVANKIIAISKRNEVDRLPDVATKRVDRRGYTSAKPVFEKLGLELSGAPYRFEFIGKDDKDGVYLDLFRLVEAEAE
jgi:hypothetical protein